MKATIDESGARCELSHAETEAIFQAVATLMGFMWASALCAAVALVMWFTA